jgi:hypothetical protein
MWGRFPKWLKYTLLFIGTTMLTYILHFPFGLLENAIYQYITDYVTETYEMPLTTFIIYCISFIAAGLIVFGAYKIGSLERKNRQNVTLKEGATKLDNRHLASTLTMMHRRMMELQKVRLSRNINLKQFESALPTLMDKLGLVELDKWGNFENSIRKRIRRAIGKKPTGTRSAYFKAICEASKIKKELSQSQDWTIQDGLKISEWLDGYHWGIRELRDNDPRWRALWDSINPYLVNRKLRELIEKHINFSYVYSSASLIAGYSRKHRASIRLSVLYEALVGSPISPVKIDLALSEILADIEKWMSVLEQEGKSIGVIGDGIQSIINKKVKDEIEQQSFGFSIKIETITIRSTMIPLNRRVNTKSYPQYLVMKISFRTNQVIQVASLHVEIDPRDPRDIISPDITLAQGFKLPYLLSKGESHEFQFLLPPDRAKGQHNLLLKVLAGGYWYTDGPYKFNC